MSDNAREKNTIDTTLKLDSEHQAGKGESFTPPEKKGEKQWISAAVSPEPHRRGTSVSPPTPLQVATGGMSLQSEDVMSLHLRNTLHFAARMGDLRTIMSLTNAGGVDLLEARSAGGKTSLHIAVENERAEAVRALLALGASAESFDHNGNTPLHFAAEKGNLDLCRVLIDRGVSVFKLNSDEHTPLYLAVANGHLGIVALFIENALRQNSKGMLSAEQFSQLIVACADRGHLQILQELLRNRSGLVAEGSNNNMLAEAAAKRGARDGSETRNGKEKGAEKGKGPSASAATLFPPSGLEFDDASSESDRDAMRRKNRKGKAKVSDGSGGEASRSASPRPHSPGSVEGGKASGDDTLGPHLSTTIGFGSGTHAQTATSGGGGGTVMMVPGGGDAEAKYLEPWQVPGILAASDRGYKAIVLALVNDTQPIPKTLSGPHALDHLSLTRTPLTALDLSFCNLEKLPRGIISLRWLQYLNLASNSLHELPEEIGSLNRLQRLDLSRNQLLSLPFQMGDLPDLRRLVIALRG